MQKTDSQCTGLKFDEQKLRWDLLPFDAVEEIVKILTYGFYKYGADNWRGGMEWRRLYGATFRHLKAAITGEDYDKESGLLHLAHAASNLLFLIEYYKFNIGKDDRFKTNNLTKGE